MKQMLKTGKKALSVFMAVMMVLTAWVWVAPTEASAVDAGTYDVQIKLQVTDTVVLDQDETDKLILYHKKNNGTDSIESQSKKTITKSALNESTAQYTFTGVGFPTGVKLDNLEFSQEWNSGWGSVALKIEVYVKKNGTYALIATSSEYSASESIIGGNYFTFDYDVPQTEAPKATKVVWDVEPSGFIIPNSTYGRTHCVDQYGVTLGVNPTNTFTSTPTTGLSGSTTNGTSYSQYTITASNSARMSGQGTNSRSVSMTASYTFGGATATGTKSFTITDPSYDVELDANGTNASLTTKTPISIYYGDKYGVTPNATRPGFTLLGFFYDDCEDSYETANLNSTELKADTIITESHKWYAAWQANKYKLTFNYKDENYTDQTYVVDEYYGRTYDMPDYPEVIEVKENGITNYKYEFKGWKVGNSLVTPPSTIPNENITYLADYEETIYYADKTNLNKAIAVAGAKLNEQQYIDGGYTDESVAAFESALQQADEALDMIYYLSQQSALDLITNSLVTATNNLTTKKYIVMFVDEDGTILKDGYHFVEYGKSVTVPANPEQEPDADYHYEFVEWNSNLSDGLSACNYVTDNLRYIATFNAIPHTFTETTTPSTCTADGVITYTCDCGYSYTAVNSADLAHHTWSTDYKELVPATCATKGSEAKYCTACGAVDESTRREITELGHAFGAYTEYTPATCFGKGSKVAECSRCQALDVIEIPQLSHQYGNSEKVEMTCIADGYTKETCSICGFVNIRDIEKTKGHTLKVETVPETCVSIGYAKTYCEKCDFERTTVYPATGWHTYPDTWETVAEATCVGHGIEKRVCTVCNSATETRLTDLADHTAPADWTTETEAWCGVEGRRVKDCTVCGKELDSEAIPALEHNYEAYPNASYPATCTSAGADAEKCSRCGDINTTVIQPSGHKYENEGAKVTTEADCTHSAFITYDCDNCDYTYTEYVIGSTVKAHTWVETEEKAADCKNDGYIRYECSVCDATKETILSKTGHSYGAWEVVKEATNDEDGQWKRVCTNNPDHIEYVTIPKGGHTFAEDAAQYIAPKCNEKGQRVYKCTAHTDCIAAVTVVLDEVQHTVKQKETAATCTKTGSVKAYCEVCGLVLSTEEIPVKAHDFVAQTPVAATCTTSGYTPYTCSCGATYNAYNENDPAKGHDFSVFVSKNDATCTADGEELYKCSRCDAEQATVLPKTGHSYVKGTVVTADCVTAGTEVYTCACGDTYTKFIEAAKGHSWSESWTVVREATDDKHGVEKTTCTVCGEEKFRTTEPIGDHKFNVVTVDATCTQPGLKTYTCSVHTDCSANYTEEIPATGHTGKLAYTAPTCTTAGSTQIICSVCSGEISDKQIIPAAGHTYDRGVVTLEAGCATTGTKTYTCSCGDSYTETIPEKGHELTTVVNDATCDKAGSVVITCANCNDPAVEKTVELAAKGHIWNTAPESTSAADCETDGSETYKCQFCDEKNVVVIPKLGHNWGAWEVVVNPTATVDGLQMRKCLRGCGVTDSVVIPALGGTTTYTVTFVADGKVIATQTVVHGGSATAPEIGNKAPDANGHYSFIWDTDFTKVTEDLTVTAVYTQAAHNYGEWITDIEATCKAQGKQHRVCADCSYTQTQTVAVKSHDYSVVKSEKEATCTESGYTVRACSYCGTTTTETTMRLGHAMTYHEYIPETCDTDGSMAYYSCSRCGKNFADRLGKTELTDIVISKKYHTFIVSEGKDPTCTAEGVTDYLYCTSCGFTQNPSSIPALGHVDANKDNACDRCGGTYMEGGEIVCTCNCHKSGIFNELIYKILLFFWRLFGMNKSCACGRVHY